MLAAGRGSREKVSSSGASRRPRRFRSLPLAAGASASSCSYCYHPQTHHFRSFSSLGATLSAFTRPGSGEAPLGFGCSKLRLQASVKSSFPFVLVKLLLPCSSSSPPRPGVLVFQIANLLSSSFGFGKNLKFLFRPRVETVSFAVRPLCICTL